MGEEIMLGVSSCLLGEKVRYDGGQQQDRYITDILGQFCRFVPVCPEVGCGLPVPREAMRLEGDPAAPRLMTRQTKIDITPKMLAFCQERLKELEQEELDGFIFKKNSPSSGLFRVKVYGSDGRIRSGSGLFAAAVARHFPLLPLEEEGRLHDPAIRENFIERVFTYHRWQELLKQGRKSSLLVRFHTRQKLLIMAHSPRHYRLLGVLVARAGELPPTELYSTYGELLMAAMSLQATAKKNSNVLMHIMGYFKRVLTSAEKEELLGLIRQYHDRLVPLIVPITLLNHYVRKYDQPYLRQQFYLVPHPVELMLRTHV